MTDIDSNRDANGTRTDQDNEKNMTSPIPGGNNADAPGSDAGNRIDSPQRDDEEAQAKDESDKGIDVELDKDNVNPRDKQNP